MYLIIYYPFVSPACLYYPPYLMLGQTPPAFLDFITPWQHCQEYMALTVLQFARGFFSLSVRLIGYGTHHILFSVPELPSLNTEIIYSMFHIR